MKPNFRYCPRAFVAAFVSTGAVAGCASTPLRSEGSTSGIRAAEEVGAESVPRASLHLQLAKEELASAQRMSGNGDTEEAASMLMRAEADAELAVALSRESAEKQDAAAAMESVKKLLNDNTPANERTLH